MPRLLILRALSIALGLGLSLTPASAAPFHLFPAPQSLHSSEVTLLWDRPTAARTDPTLQFEIFRNDQRIATTSKTYFTATDLTPDHDYTFTVHARTAHADLGLSEVFTTRTPSAEVVVSVLDHGAVGDGKTLNTRALQAAIDACPPGGIVFLPSGIFLSGALYLKSDMTLHIAKDGVLKGTSNPADYLPFNLNRFEGWEMSTHASLLNGGTLDRTGPANLRNVSIRGEGTISGGGRKLHDAIVSQYPNRTEGFRARGRLILLMNAENIEIAGLTVEESPCWTLHYIYCDRVSLHGLTIRSDVPNGDGIDPDSSTHSYIFNCTFDTGDDCIAIKSGKNPEGNLVNRPTEDVRITDCVFNRGHGISIGSEMSGGVRGVLVDNCVAGPLLNGLQIKGTKDRGGFVEDVVVRNCDLQKITVFTVLSYNNDGQAAPVPPFFRHFTFENIDLRNADTSKPIIIINGFEAEGHRTAQLTFDQLQLPSGAGIVLDQVEAATFTNLSTPDGTNPTFQITRSESITH